MVWWSTVGNYVAGFFRLSIFWFKPFYAALFLWLRLIRMFVIVLASALLACAFVPPALSQYNIGVSSPIEVGNWFLFTLWFIFCFGLIIEIICPLLLLLFIFISWLLSWLLLLLSSRLCIYRTNELIWPWTTPIYFVRWCLCKRYLARVFLVVITVPFLFLFHALVVLFDMAFMLAFLLSGSSSCCFWNFVVSSCWVTCIRLVC